MSVNSCIACGSPLPEGRGNICSICISTARTIPGVIQAPTRQPQQKNVRYQFIGWNSRLHGEQFENTIMQACEFYRMKNIADIEKTPEPMKVLKDMGNGRFLACFTKSAQADFKGIMQGGRAVNFEAKYTDRGRLEQSVVTEAQTERLQRAYEYGAHTFVMVAFGIRDIYRIPWGVWRNMKDLFGHKYITPAEVSEYRVSYHNGYLMFLEGLD